MGIQAHRYRQSHADNRTSCLPPPGSRVCRSKAMAFSVLWICAGLLISCCFLYPFDDGGCAVHEFVEAFVAADVGRAKAVAVPEQWGRVEEAMKGRQPFRCPVEWRLEELWNWEIGASGWQVSKDEYIWGASYVCGTEPYCLDIEDIRVVRTENGWKVYDWGRICEVHNYYCGFGECR